jgi:hypothetical protein
MPEDPDRLFRHGRPAMPHHPILRYRTAVAYYYTFEFKRTKKKKKKIQFFNFFGEKKVVRNVNGREKCARNHE